jgi:hypothetical protein
MPCAASQTQGTPVNESLLVSGLPKRALAAANLLCCIRQTMVLQHEGINDESAVRTARRRTFLQDGAFVRNQKIQRLQFAFLGHEHCRLGALGSGENKIISQLLKPADHRFSPAK